ncbi:MAG TPA: MBOAT family protein [Candidatus Cybelea sp.]|jgi:D-alanyl-lipoteichoic acid acyltransferase DltB (MBOAT superfamily)|nr:MBOAT family protein [Candidatus Cybelea sp.]
MTRGGTTGAILIAGAFAIFALVDVVAFRTSLYRSILDPSSSTGSFEASIAAYTAFAADPKRDVLVLGDSRIYSALDPRVASLAGRGLRFLNGGVPGTTPRCWPYFIRAIDPAANRFRAVVIAVDTYADNDSAIGSLDGDDRPLDLRYIVFQTGLRDLPKLAGSFSDPRERVEHGIDLFLRGPELRDDFQELAADPVARVVELERVRDAITYAPLADHPRRETLAGMRVDFATDSIIYPPGLPDVERTAIATQVLHVAKPSPSYARYRLEWLTPIASRYRKAGTPVIFVRIPTRPAHRLPAELASGSLVEIARDEHARLIPSQKYVALEQPELFADEDHLNRAGSLRFSRFLGADVTHMLADAPQAAQDPAPPAPSQQRRQRRELSWLTAAAGIGIPLRFQSYEFWLFFAIVAALFYACPIPRRAGRIVLLFASYYFYARWNAWYVLFLWILTGSDYLIAIALERSRAGGRWNPRALLAVGVAANLAFLGSFKYTNFASGTVAALIGMHQNPWLVNLFVPIGISFHTFQSISYLVDVYRGRMAAVRKLSDYALYLAFFPQLLAGPIVRAGLFFGELFSWRAPGPEDISYGLARAGFGLVKKMAVADQFAAVANGYFDSIAAHPGAPAAWSAVFAFGMQIYFDFSGYSDIAIGCARVFGFVFPENFAMPYLATSITDFWHRWHITLSTWLRDYLYIPLGGSRHGRLETLRNLMLTMLLGGLWHGAQWTFVAWGGFHGAMLCIERILGIGHERGGPRGAVAVARVLVTFTIVTLGWVLFRSPTFGIALTVYRELLVGGPGPALLTGWQTVLAAGIVAFGAVRLLFDRLGVTPTWPRLRPLAQAGTLAGLLLALEMLSWPGISPSFIYFKF